jgi:hypothetical protein
VEAVAIAKRTTGLQCDAGHCKKRDGVKLWTRMEGKEQKERKKRKKGKREKRERVVDGPRTEAMAARLVGYGTNDVASRD